MRERLKKGGAAIVVAASLGACSPVGDGNREYPPATVTRTFFTPEVEVPTIVLSGDKNIQSGLRQAYENDIVILKDPFIGSITRIKNDTYLANVDVQETNSTKREIAAITTNAECIFTALGDADKLGEYHFGIWKPDVRLNELKAVIEKSYSVTTPRPLIRAIEVKSVNNEKKIVKTQC